MEREKAAEDAIAHEEQQVVRILSILKGQILFRNCFDQPTHPKFRFLNIDFSQYTLCTKEQSNASNDADLSGQRTPTSVVYNSCSWLIKTNNFVVVIRNEIVKHIKLCTTVFSLI